MENRKPPNETEFAESLRAKSLSLPPLTFKLIKTQPKFDGPRVWDFKIEVQWGNQKAQFAAEYKSLSTPKVFEETLRACQTPQLPKDCFPLIIMPFLRRPQLDELEQAGVSGVDLCGNGVVMVPNRFWVFRTGNANQFTTYAPIKNIYRRNTSMVARALLTAPSFPSVQELLDEVNRRNILASATSETPTTLGTVSKALRQLEDDLIVSRDVGVRLFQADKLLEKLQQNYKPLKTTNRVKLKIDCDFDKLPKMLADKLNEKSGPVVANGLSSVNLYAVMQREEKLSLYCQNLAKVQKAIGANETDRFFNLELIETAEQPLYFDAQKEAGFYWASPVQTYLELMAGDKRDQEVAEQVKNVIVRQLKKAK